MDLILEVGQDGKGPRRCGFLAKQLDARLLECRRLDPLLEGGLGLFFRQFTQGNSDGRPGLDLFFTALVYRTEVHRRGVIFAAALGDMTETMGQYVRRELADTELPDLR